MVILIDRVRRVTGYLTDDEHGGFREWRGCVDQIFTLKQICEEAREKCSKKVASGRRVVGAIRSLVKARELQLNCARVLHETLLVSILMYGSETML